MKMTVSSMINLPAVHCLWHNITSIKIHIFLSSKIICTQNIQKLCDKTYANDHTFSFFFLLCDNYIYLFSLHFIHFVYLRDILWFIFFFFPSRHQLISMLVSGWLNWNFSFCQVQFQNLLLLLYIQMKW